jgi:hypothetical protein
MQSVQRDALMGAILDELVREGYWGVSTERARDAAGVSAIEFEADYGDKDGCLLAAYDWLAEQALAKAVGRCSIEDPWPERMRRGLETLLEELAAWPERAQSITRSFAAISGSGYERYTGLLGTFAPFVAQGREYSGLGGLLPAGIELLAIGAAEAIVFPEVDAGRSDLLPEMLPEILFALLVPFIGPERAAVEMRRAATPAWVDG